MRSRIDGDWVGGYWMRAERRNGTASGDAFDRSVAKSAGHAEAAAAGTDTTGTRHCSAEGVGSASGHHALIKRTGDVATRHRAESSG